MTDLELRPKTETATRPARPRLYRVLLLNDDFTPRGFVVQVLRAVFRLSADQAQRVMIVAHTRGLCVIAVYTRDVAETKAAQGIEAARREGYPLAFLTEPEPNED